MAIKHTAVSYYGLNYVEHAIADFKEMKEHGCDTVILAITEFDMDFWFPNINNIVKAAHELGLRVIADTWGIGKYFGGEQVSLFLQNNIHHRQVSAYTGEVLNAACFCCGCFFLDGFVVFTVGGHFQPKGILPFVTEIKAYTHLGNIVFLAQIGYKMSCICVGNVLCSPYCAKVSIQHLCVVVVYFRSL